MSSLALENRRVLVLNKQYRPINVCPMKRAIGLLSSNYPAIHDGFGKIIRKEEPKARIYDPSSDFQTYTWAEWGELMALEGEKVFRLPDIILLSRYDKMPVQRVHFNRKTIYRRDNHTCQYCGCKPGDGELTIDHVTPKAQGGLTTWENVVLACVQCNSQKADRRPEQAFKNCKNWKGPSPMKLLSVPKKPKYNLFKGDQTVIPKSWSEFISEVYWSTGLESDM